MNFIVKIFKACIGSVLMLLRLRVFNPKKIFQGKRIAIIGAADSALEEEKGEFIDKFDYVIRINKALITWKESEEKYLGSKTDILIHTFRENDINSGGHLDFRLFQKHRLKYLLSAINNSRHYRRIFNIYKKYLTFSKIYILRKEYSVKSEVNFGSYIPTSGFRALHMVLESNPREVYVTGMTFYKTPYADGYRDHYKDMNINLNRIKKEGIHNPDLEFSLFLNLLKKKSCKITFDNKLTNILNSIDRKLVNTLENAVYD